MNGKNWIVYYSLTVFILMLPSIVTISTLLNIDAKVDGLYQTVAVTNTTYALAQTVSNNFSVYFKYSFQYSQPAKSEEDIFYRENNYLEASVFFDFRDNKPRIKHVETYGGINACGFFCDYVINDGLWFQYILQGEQRDCYETNRLSEHLPSVWEFNRATNSFWHFINNEDPELVIKK